MLPVFLVPETTVGEEGHGPEVDLGPSRGKSLLLTLGITRIIEQESLDVSVWGSADQTSWGTKPLVSFPQKFYCGTYQIQLDLSPDPEIKYVRVHWKTSRWGRGEPNPLFGFYLFAEETAEQVLAAQSASPVRP
jgi:hypothetical protein